MTESIDDLVAVMRARFQAEQGKLKQVLEHEQRLRAEAATLEDRHRAAQSEYHGELSSQHFYGGDVLWQAWVGRTRRQLQMELAQVLVQKGQMTGAMKRAHGRKLASEALKAEKETKMRKALYLREIEQEQSLRLNDLAQRAKRL